ncbi:MAG TPA: hypothetical protein VFI37_13620 [Gaiellaceae bacterium]|nr:hypothetical protein [Gaiellaceae bacterium]
MAPKCHLLAAAAAGSAAALACVSGAQAAPRVAVVVVPPFPLERHAGEGAVGLLVPGSGETVTRADALAALERGKVQPALLGGKPAGAPLIRPAREPGEVTVYVSLPPAGTHANSRRYPVAIVGGGYHGLLLSSSTRIEGLVSVADVAPSVLALERGETPPIGSRPDADAAADLRRLDARLADVRGARLPVRLAVAGVLLAALAAGLLFRRRTAARAGLLVPPLVLGAVLALSAFHEGRTAVAVVVVLAGGLAASLAARAGDTLLALVVAGFLAAFLGALAAWPSLNGLSTLGPHPDGGGRYYGVTNEVETLLLAPALAAGAVSGPLLPLVGALALAAIGWSRAGADGGGLLVYAVAFAVLWTRLARPRTSLGRLVVAVAGAVALGFALVWLDRATGGTSHVTAAVGSGSGLVGDAVHRWHVSWAAATASWPVVIESLGGLLGLIVFGLVGRRSATVDALLVGVAVSLLVNDTPQDVLAFGALTCGSLWVWERLRAPERRSEPFVFRPLPRSGAR